MGAGRRAGDIPGKVQIPHETGEAGEVMNF